MVTAVAHSHTPNIGGALNNLLNQTSSVALDGKREKSGNWTSVAGCLPNTPELKARSKNKRRKSKVFFSKAKGAHMRFGPRERVGLPAPF